MASIRAALRMLQRHPAASDAVLALVLAVFVLQDVLLSNGDYLTGQKSVYVPAAVLMTAPLAWRRRAPLLVTAVVMAALAAQSLLLPSSAPYPDSELVPLLVAVYSVAAHGRGRTPVVGIAISLAAGLVWVGADDFFLPVVAFGGAWLAGRLVQKRQVYADALEERARVLEREREANARMAAAEERVRLARELHDVVGHSVSVMVVQAGAERLALGDGRPQTREALLAIERTGREALTEMSRLLGLLRQGDERLALAPRPSLAQIGPLVQSVRDTGVSIAVSVEGEPLTLSPSLDISAYRVVQEALTNVVKHAEAAHASVVVRYRAGEVEIEVTDDGRGVPNGNGAGYGLLGMRERVELHGGTLDAAGGSDGGFVVKALLPFAAGRR
jgi:signal transduction histidine kinase